MHHPCRRLLIGAVLLAFGSSAERLWAEPDKQPTLVVHVAGKSLGRGAMQLEIETGPIATHGVIILSEPSGRVLAVVMNQQFEKSPEASAWVARISRGGPIGARGSGPLPAGFFTFGLPDRPEEDTGITVRVMGTWPNGRVEERLVAEMTLGRQFDFTSSLSVGGDYEICCGGEGTPCTKECLTCSGPRVTCCNYGPPDCCSIQCGNHPICQCDCNFTGCHVI